MHIKSLLTGIVAVALFSCSSPSTDGLVVRQVEKFSAGWRFLPGDSEAAHKSGFDDSNWELLDLPHDWSINEPYHIDNPGGYGTSFMIGGVGWYRKSFLVPEEFFDKRIEITFDGVYQNSTVYLNGEKLGTRPYGYISFKYDLSPHLVAGSENTIAVRVDNSDQPNSRWYTGSGIYRNVWLTITDQLFIDSWGVFITTPIIDEVSAMVKVETVIRNERSYSGEVDLKAEIFSHSGEQVAKQISGITINENGKTVNSQQLEVKSPSLWSFDSPQLYTLKLTILEDQTIIDDYVTTFGIRSFYFDPSKGFHLNDKPLKIKGVCMHHDLGALGAAVNVRAIERQLEILRDMGVNAIRTAHNPPAPELLHLTDKMGFIVMNETFDTWQMAKVENDYSVYWDNWHGIDLRDHILRDRNHPSVMMWSIGNEILEQWHPQGTIITNKLAGIVRELDPTRPITAGNNNPSPDNSLIKSGELDLIGHNYHHEGYENFPEIFPGEVFIAAETTSALATRGSYDMPSDSVRRWPYRWDETFLDGNEDHTCSSYDNCSAPWGSTHAETWSLIKKHVFLSGMFIWTGFDYLGEPTPYEWPSRSSYFGVVDLAGFPKDAYYMYQSEWTEQTVLHLFPHWNWEPGQEIDIWAYYNNADEVELFLNGTSMGSKSKGEADLHVCWRVTYEPGTLNVISRKNGEIVKERVMKTAGPPVRMKVNVDRSDIVAGGEDLSFITVEVVDENGNLVPTAGNLINVTVSGNGTLAGVDNGSQINHQPFQGEQISAFNGKCLVIVRSGRMVREHKMDMGVSMRPPSISFDYEYESGKMFVLLESEGLPDEIVEIQVNSVSN